MIDSPEYRDIQDKVCLIIPEGSLVGILLTNKEEKKVIKSSAAGMQQHYPYTWEVLGASFVEAESQSQASLFLDETLQRWGEGLDEDLREKLVKAVFDAMDATGAQTITELNARRLSSYNAIFKALLDMDPGLQKDLLKTAQKLAAAGKDVLLEDAEISLKETLAEFADHIRSRDKKENDA